ncbi:serine hydrolase [Solibacillus sp. CAU 1738]|uniref:serine hydrolase n=1 Tax=Solibacillus sp. CAU 1738 TaxID=3140363 RepID=UPI0032603AE3
MSILLITIIAFCGVIGIIIFVSGLKLQEETKGGSPEKVIAFLKGNINSENVSFSLNANNVNVVRVNENKKLPLASTVKIIIAIEYARQAAEGIIDSTELISLDTLDTFYIPKTDGGAHPAWLSKLENTVEIPLEEVVKGMILYSSNANTEFLMHKLGLENINKMIERLEIKNHDVLFPIASALFIPVHLKREGLTKQQVYDQLLNMSLEQYREKANLIHECWLKQPLTAAQKREYYQYVAMRFQKIWSDRLPGSTTADYINLMQKLNSRQFLSESIHHYLDPILEQSPPQEGIQYIGKKGGSTSFVLTMAMYAKDNEGNTTELALFANELTFIQQQKLANNIGEFQLKLLQDKAFKQHVMNEIS